MNFGRRLAQAVVAGRKTTIRTTEATTWRTPRDGQPGRVVAVQPASGKDPIAHIEILERWREFAGAITFDGARAEGFRTTAEFKAWWVGHYDAAWIKRQETDPTEQQLVERFDTRHASTPVWVYRFALTQAPALLLSTPDPVAGTGDYTSEPARSIDDLEVVDSEILEQYATQARVTDLQRRRGEHATRELRSLGRRIKEEAKLADGAGIDISAPLADVARALAHMRELREKARRDEAA